MNRAFSLVELSIVLVILGLLTGGILAGQSLIKAAAIKNDVQKVERIKQAVATFRDKYFALPGDMRNATAFWSTNSDCAPLSAASSVGVCNGNGDGRINNATAANNDFREFASVNPHLASAGLISGSYLFHNNQPTAYTPGGVADKFMLSSAWPRSFLTTYFMSCQNIWTGWLATCNRNKHYITIQGEDHWPNSSSNIRTAYIPSEDAFLIDTKYDDGRAMSGSILSWSHNYIDANACLTGNNPNTSDYIMTSGHQCDLFFQAPF